MTIMSARGLNVTAKLTQKGKSGGMPSNNSQKGTDIDERIETEGDDDFDV